MANAIDDKNSGRTMASVKVDRGMGGRNCIFRIVVLSGVPDATSEIKKWQQTIEVTLPVIGLAQHGHAFQKLASFD